MLSCSISSELKLLLLCAHPPAVNAPHARWGGATPLLLAIDTDYLPAVSMLLEADADANTVDARDGYSPLMAAAHIAHVEMVVELLERGAHANHADESGRTALMCAVADERNEVSDVYATVVALLAAGANVEAQARDGATALVLAQDTYIGGQIQERQVEGRLRRLIGLLRSRART